MSPSPAGTTTPSQGMIDRQQRQLLAVERGAPARKPRDGDPQQVRAGAAIADGEVLLAAIDDRGDGVGVRLDLGRGLDHQRFERGIERRDGSRQRRQHRGAGEWRRRSRQAVARSGSAAGRPRHRGEARRSALRRGRRSGVDCLRRPPGSRHRPPARVGCSPTSLRPAAAAGNCGSRRWSSADHTDARQASGPWRAAVSSDCIGAA